MLDRYFAFGLLLGALALVVFLFWLGEARQTIVEGETGAEYDCTFADQAQIRELVRECEAVGRRQCVLEAADAHCQRMGRRL